ncbi:BHLH domain-containing protein [Trichonephila clavata]|uniref:BHLH domain-containing protein n=1 Tax=Trichonephila clavata TaxID=2740835 RepID=A0A8X6H4N6_TRICU|nr:BHLH domain-containing protein [Trichonephila clavata]
MYRSDMDTSPSDLKLTEDGAVSTGVLVESNRQATATPPLWLSHISASSRRRREVLLLKQRKEKMRRRRMVRRMEYQRLRNMVPSIATKPLVSKVTVIEEAIRYIDYLHSALLTRLRTKGLPSCLRGVDVDVNHLNLDDIKELRSTGRRIRIPPSPTTRDPACYLPTSPLDIRSKRGRNFKQKTLISIRSTSKRHK